MLPKKLCQFYYFFFLWTECKQVKNVPTTLQKVSKNEKEKSYLETAMGINCQEKRKKRAVKIWLSAHPQMLLSILRSFIPFFPVPNSHQASRWLAAIPARPRCLTKTYTHPRNHLIRRHDFPVSGAPLVFCCVLTGQCWFVLACECVQGFRGQSCAAASAPRCGLSLTCQVKQKAQRTATHMCARW